ncbi:MAG: hypothetical protein P8L18_05630 [Verrucomicrobiota bacterium]|nr:hypothetical protein [Verrucomicrobiota bacterium]
MHLPPPGEAEAMSRLTFVSTSAAWKLTTDEGHEVPIETPGSYDPMPSGVAGART